MYKTIAAAVLAVFLSANGWAANEGDGENNDVCDLIGGIAKTSMQLRLSGKPFKDTRSDLMEIMGGGLQTWIDEMLIEAYESPRYTTTEAKSRAVEEFENKWYLACFRLDRN